MKKTQRGASLFEEVDQEKQLITSFVIKLYHILEKNQFSDHIAWASQGTEVLIKNPKKLEEKVLPYFFRHRHLSSFIRQLNMYGFSKVNKIQKERSYMYFKNEDFRQGNMQQMKAIKRTHKSKKSEHTQIQDEDSNTNRDQSTETELNALKEEAQAKFFQLQQIFTAVIDKYPGIKRQLWPAVDICQRSTGESNAFDFPSFNNVLPFTVNEQNENKNMLATGNTLRDLPFTHSIRLPSLCSFNNFDD